MRYFIMVAVLFVSLYQILPTEEVVIEIPKIQEKKETPKPKVTHTRRKKEITPERYYIPGEPGHLAIYPEGFEFVGTVNPQRFQPILDRIATERNWRGVWSGR